MDVRVTACLAAAHWLSHNLPTVWKQHLRGEALIHVRHSVGNRFDSNHLNLALQS